MYDFYLGGKDNFAADREAAQRMIDRIPQIPAAAIGNRQFLQRAVTAVAESGVKQFVDIGSGLPTMENTHQVAHRIDPAIKVAYVDRDPQVISHARAILQDGGTKDNVLTLDGDLRESFVLTQLLSPYIDWSQPVALMLVAVMHFINPPEAYRVADAYKEKMAPGSYLILSHSTADRLSEEEAALIQEEYEKSNAGIYLRTKQQVTRFFEGTDITEPGVTDVVTWRSGPVVAQPTMVYGGVGKKAAA
jgi:O-methyltransferase involved in polyketide biosynthesis